MVQIYTKTDSRFQKSYEEFGQLQTSSGKSKNLKFNALHLSKSYIPSAKTLYTEDLSTLFSNTFKLFFTTQFVYIILAQTLHTFDKNIP